MLSATKCQPLVCVFDSDTWKIVQIAWVAEKRAWVEGTFGEDKSYDDFIRYAATALLTPNRLDDFRQFFEPMMDIPALTRTGIAEISARVELIERAKTDVLSALQTTLYYIMPHFDKNLLTFYSVVINRRLC